MTDIQQALGGSLIQHGKASDRIYLMELEHADMPQLIDELERLADEHDYSKIFAKVPGRWSRAFHEAGYLSEAVVPCFFSGDEEGHFMGLFRDSTRSFDPSTAQLQQVLHVASKKKHTTASAREALCDLTIRRCDLGDVEAMAEVYRRVFESYPFPIMDPVFLAETMETNVVYFGAWHEDELISLASAEQYLRCQNAEMTDFATVPEHRGCGIAQRLLERIEGFAASAGHLTAFTIARASSMGMNVTFARGGYSLAGTLINNTQISGRIESMNVWYRSLQEPSLKDDS